MNTNLSKAFLLFRLTFLLVIGLLLGACAHPIMISPLDNTPISSETSLSPKKVAYVMTEADRSKQVTTAGGGGDKISYFPYRDLEKAIRDALRSIYSDVFVIASPSDNGTIKENNISFIFIPEIITSSSSSSIFTWPPTQFNIDFSCRVTDPVGNTVSNIKIAATGTATFSEFKTDFGLAGRRAASDLSERLKQEIRANPRLR